MSEDASRLAEREEIEMLLPWYVTGRLEADDRARVERYLAGDAGLRHQLDLIRAEQANSIAANEALRAPSAGALDRLISALPARQPTLSERLTSSMLYQAVADVFVAPTARGVRFAAMAVAALLLVQAAIITALLVRDGTGTYHTAAGRNDDKGISAFVVFAEDARLPAITRLLMDFDATIVDGPKPGGAYRIRMRASDGSETTRDALLRRLAERRDIVRSVLPAPD